MKLSACLGVSLCLLTGISSAATPSFSGSLSTYSKCLKTQYESMVESSNRNFFSLSREEKQKVADKIISVCGPVPKTFSAASGLMGSIEPECELGGPPPSFCELLCFTNPYWCDG